MFKSLEEEGLQSVVVKAWICLKKDDIFQTKHIGKNVLAKTEKEEDVLNQEMINGISDRDITCKNIIECIIWKTKD